jgi:integrase
MSSVYPKGKWLYFRVKIDGEWAGIQTDFKVGQEKAAKAMLAKYDARQAAGEAVLSDFGPVTVARFYVEWIKAREAEVQTWDNDEAVMRLHVLPTLGSRKIDEVTAGDVLKLIKSWRARSGSKTAKNVASRKMAPRSIYTAYSTLCAFFRDAALEGLLAATPCLLTKRQLGPKVDANPEFRPLAQFTRAELEQLISDERIPFDRRIVYALEGVAALRHGEMAGLLWRNCGVEVDLQPLRMLFVAYSYERALPKGDVCRPVPIHPTLDAMLAEWKEFGWAKMMGRKPGPNDLVVPLPPHAIAKRGRWRRKGYTYDRLEQDLELLGMRHRRGHDLRRTFISLARSGGAVADIQKRATHKPPKEVIEGYTTFEWDVVCREVAKLNVQRAPTAQVLTLRKPKFATSLATNGVQAMESIEEDPLFATRFESGEGHTGSLKSSGLQLGSSTACEHCGAQQTPAEPAKPATTGSTVASDQGRRALRLLKRLGGGR